MNINLLTLQMVGKQLTQLGADKISFAQVIELLEVAFQSDTTHGATKSAQLKALMGCLKNIVADRVRLEELKAFLEETATSGLDNKSELAMIQNSEAELNETLYVFCETFNTLCRVTAVGEYFVDINRDTLWKDLFEFFKMA